MSEKRDKYYNRRFRPTNLHKYLGADPNLILRSSWEVKFAKWCDRTESVIGWAYESTVIPYKCKTDDRMHRYFMDFKIKVKDKDNQVKKYLVEIKPYYQTQRPSQDTKKRRKSTIIRENFNYLKNVSKWEAAKEYCKRYGYEFLIMTEHDLRV